MLQKLIQFVHYKHVWKVMKLLELKKLLIKWMYLLQLQEIKILLQLNICHK